MYTFFFGFILFTAFLIIENKYSQQTKFKFESLFLLVIFLFYSYGFTLVTNRLFDTNNPTSIECGIVNRYEENEKYYLELENNSWREVDKYNRIEIGKFIYKTLEKEESVTVKTCDGFLGISWFYYDIFEN